MSFESLTWEQLIGQGIFTALFIALFIYTLKKNEIREEKYQDTIKMLGDSIGIIKEIKEDIDVIKQKL